MRKYVQNGRRLATCQRGETEPVVREGLAYSPADMARLADKGIPVNNLVTGKLFYDGSDDPSFHVGAERERFVDVADLWEQHMTIRDKARKAAKMRRTKSQ